MLLSEDRTANRTSRSRVSFPIFVPMEDVNPMERVWKQRNEPFIQTSVVQECCNGATLCFRLTHTDVAFAFLSCPIDISILVQILCPLYVRFCPKLQTMPHIKGNPGSTAGTVHHCPGRKISSYVKLSACRGEKENGYCLTHQIPCPAPDCREKHWARLKNEPCTFCEQRRKVSLAEMNALLYCAETKLLASRAVSSGRTAYRQRSQSPGSNRQQRAKKGGRR